MHSHFRGPELEAYGIAFIFIEKENAVSSSYRTFEDEPKVFPVSKIVLSQTGLFLDDDLAQRSLHHLRSNFVSDVTSGTV